MALAMARLRTAGASRPPPQRQRRARPRRGRRPSGRGAASGETGDGFRWSGDGARSRDRDRAGPAPPIRLPASGYRALEDHHALWEPRHHAKKPRDRRRAGGDARRQRRTRWVAARASASRPPKQTIAAVAEVDPRRSKSAGHSLRIRLKRSRTSPVDGQGSGRSAVKSRRRAGSTSSIRSWSSVREVLRQAQRLGRVDVARHVLLDEAGKQERRSVGSTAGGILAASSSGSKAPPIRSSSLGSPTGMSRGRRSSPSERRTNASVIARPARLLGIRRIPCASLVLSPPKRASSPAASVGKGAVRRDGVDGWPGRIHHLAPAYARPRISSVFRMLGARRHRTKALVPAPKQRPASIARSHRMLVEKGPSGTSQRKSRFESILNAGIDEGGDGARLLPANGARCAHVEVALPVMAVRTRQRHEKEQGVHALVVPKGGKLAQSVDRAIDPQIVGIDDEERIGVDQRQRLDQAAAGFEQEIALVRDSDLNAFYPCLEMLFEHIGKIVDVDDRLLHSGRPEPVEGVVEEGARRLQPKAWDGWR